MNNISSGKLKIIFVGIPDMALVCLSNLLIKRFNIAGVVPPKKTNETYRFFKDFVLNKGLNFLDFDNSPDEAGYIEKIKSLNADIGVVCSYNDKLSSDFLSSTRLGYINCHPSLLPEYRGGMPYFHVINNGETQTGITLHFMNENFDEGDIIYREVLPLTPYDTMGTVFNKTTFMISDALIETLIKIEKGIEIKRIPQKKDGNFKKAHGVSGIFRIDFKKDDCSAISRLVRACNPFYQVYCMFRETKFQILKAHAEILEHDFKFGAIVECDENNLKIAAPRGLLCIDFAQIGSWGAFGTKEIYNIFRPKTNEFME